MHKGRQDRPNSKYTRGYRKCGRGCTEGALWNRLECFNFWTLDECRLQAWSCGILYILKKKKPTLNCFVCVNEAVIALHIWPAAKRLHSNSWTVQVQIWCWTPKLHFYLTKTEYFSKVLEPTARNMHCITRASVVMVTKWKIKQSRIS